MFRRAPRPYLQPALWLLPLMTLTCALLVHHLTLNSYLFQMINTHAASLIHANLWESLTILGDGLVATALLLIFYRDHPKAVLATLISGLCAAAWVHLFKGLYEIPRPAMVLGADTLNQIGPQLMRGSFPSGHTATLFALLGSLALWLKHQWLSRLFPFLLGVALLAALSRSAVGAHWPLDILIGATLGWISALLVNTFMSELQPTAPAINWLGRFLTACTIYLLFIHHSGYSNAQPILHGIALFALAAVGLQHLQGQTSNSAAAELTMER